MQKTKNKKNSKLEKVIDFSRKLFAGILRSRTGSLSELCLILRFQPSTKGFERCYNRLLPLINELKEAFKQSVSDHFPDLGLRLGIFDDSPIKKTGKQFPKQRIDHDHNTNSFYSGMRVLSTGIYQRGKFAAISSRIVGKEDNKLTVAQDDINMLVKEYGIEIFLFDSWYCKSPVLNKIKEHKAIFISRLRCDTSVILDEENKMRIDYLTKQIPHKEYQHVRIWGKSYWIHEMYLELESYGELRVVLSKEGQHEKPIFLATNAENFTPKFIVKLYLRRFSIEVFFKDAKQFLNFETFMCRKQEKWDLHLHSINILHWAIQKKKSISKTVRRIRESVDKCLLFINQNELIIKFIEKLKKLCQT